MKQLTQDNKEYILEVSLREYVKGKTGYQKRAAEILGVRSNTLDKFLSRQTEWESLREVSDSLVPELVADHPELRRLERTNRALSDQLADTRKKLKESDRRAHVTENLVEVMRDEMSPLEIRDLPSAHVEDAEYKVDGALLLSDEHADHRVLPELTMGVEDFDFNVFRCRLERLAKTTIGYVSHHLPKYLFERFWIFKLGDACQGDIHDMKLRNHFGNSVKAAVAIADAEADFIAKLSPYFPGGVHVVSVPGNHSRTTRMKQNEDPHDNLDYAITCGIAQRLNNYISDGRVTIHAPYSWTALVDVRGWNIVLNHGDNVRGFAGFPWYGFDRREGRVKALLNRVLDRPIDYFMYGHFHTSLSRTTADSKAIHNGAFYQTAGYETNALALGNLPSQELLVFQDKEEDRGHIMQVPIYLRNRAKEAALRQGEYDPAIGRELTLDKVSGEKVVPGVAPIIRAP